MESHPELNSDHSLLEIRKRIHATYSRIGHDQYEHARNLLDLRPSDNVLDIGCGLGEFLIGLRSNGHLGKLVGIDISRELVEQAKFNAESKGLGVEFHLVDGESLDFPAGSFDCVAALHVLGQADPDRILPEIARVLRAGGRVLISTNSRSSYPLFEELKQRALERFGWILANERIKGFDSESAGEVLRRYFGRVEEARFEDVLQYPDAEVLVDFFRSTRGLWSDRLTGEEWERIIDWARDHALELIPEHGYAEDPESFSLFLCTVPLGF